VFRFLVFVLKNLGRNRLRTTLTGLAVVVLMAIYTFAGTVTDKVNQMVAAHSSQVRLIVRERWTTPSHLPIRYVRELAGLDGVEDWTVWHAYAGFFDDAGNAGAGFATRMDNFREMHPEMDRLDPAALEAISRCRNGALVGRWILDHMHWQVGQKYILKSFTHPGKDLEFEIVGELPSEIWARCFFFREDYFQEAVADKETVNVVWLRASDVQTSKRLAAQIEERFSKRRVQVRVETEAAGVGRLLERTEAVVNIVNFVVVVLLVDMVLVLSNSINMTVRERRQEMAILKVLGFPPSFIVAMVVGEALAVGLVGGMLGAALAFGVSELNLAGRLPFSESFLLEFPVPAKFVWHGSVVGALVGFLGSILPAWRAQKVKAAEVFANPG
jgi:putative ABC transport system permease protein